MKRTIFIITFFLSVVISWPASAEDTVNLMTAVEDVARKVGPTVVSIHVEQIQHYRGRPGAGNPRSDDESFNQFFEDFFGGYPEYERKAEGLGSGVIVNAKGYILTNAHVIQGADTITVSLPDGRNLPAQLVGTDSRSDLALVKIEAANLPVAELNDSSNLKIGQWVVAIGNPSGYILADPSPTVTFGVISALHRALPVSSRRNSTTDYSDLIQTDAAINPGNSGGPLVDIYGKVIGINVAIISQSGGYEGIGFSVPINYAKAIMEQIIDGKKIDYGWIGVSIQGITERLAKYFNLPTTAGVLVHQVIAGSPAEKAGIKEGDIIVSLNGTKIRNSAALIRYVTNAEAGKEIAVELFQEGKKKTIPVIVGKRPGEGPIEQNEEKKNTPAQEVQDVWRGLKVTNINEQTAARLNLVNGGIIITDVAPDSSAQRAGLRINDIIIAINKQPVHSIGEYKKAAAQIKGSCLIRTQRGYVILDD